MPQGPRLLQVLLRNMEVRERKRGGPAADPDENVDFASPTLAAELAEARRLRRVRIEAVMRHYDAENTRWEEANRTLANELAAARRRIAELEQDLTRAPPTPSTASSGTLHVPSSHLTTPTKAALLKIRFRTGAGAAAPRQPNFEQDDDPLPPQKRARVDLDAARDTEAQSQVVAALQDEIERLEAENAALRQAASAVPPSPSKWPGHEISNSRLRIKELEKELAATRKALDVADDYTEKLSARIAELETTGRR
ncbi:hypothetical protein DFJ74DRAFT_426543 [Hyaloraphidium curvatum]|nr:hypothetical protein DFJ74DRAFT_426543 [Hyaloraphidium curvatum]